MDEPQRECGLFSSSLVLQQTNPDQREERRRRFKAVVPGQRDFDRRAEREAYRLPPPEDVEVSFRHGGWRGDRQRVRSALVACAASSGRLERFDACGTDCVIEFSPTLQRHRIRGTYCGDRFCVPCANARTARVRPIILQRCKGKRVRFVTLTRLSDQNSLTAAVDHCYRSFAKLRETKLWRGCVTGGAAVLEITRGKSGLAWHVHLHVLVVGSYIDQAKLSDAWRRASGGSFIVDVREVKDHERGIGYVTKYVSKGFDRSVVLDPEALLEAVVALRGRRVFSTFGEWHGDDVDVERVEATDWRSVGRLRDVARDSLAGQPWAIGVCRSLNVWFASDRSGLYACSSETG